jgi:hypothetical protein
MAKLTVWNIEWKTFCAQWKPIYTADRAIVRAAENIKKASRARSVFECQVWVFWRYWKESTVRPSSTIERANMIPKKTLQNSSSTFAPVDQISDWGFFLRYIPCWSCSWLLPRSGASRWSWWLALSKHRDGGCKIFRLIQVEAFNIQDISRIYSTIPKLYQHLSTWQWLYRYICCIGNLSSTDVTSIGKTRHPANLHQWIYKGKPPEQ